MQRQSLKEKLFVIINDTFASSIEQFFRQSTSSVLGFQQSYRPSQNTPCDNWCFNIKDINSKRNELLSPVIRVPPPLNYSVINTRQLSLVRQHSSISSQNTSPELQASSIPGRTSSDLSNTITLLSTNHGLKASKSESKLDWR